DLILAGGTEEISCILAPAAFDGLHALSTRNDNPPTASRPFDRTRDGFVIGEGAGALILEERGHARRVGAAVAMRAALRDAGAYPTRVRYINAHGPSTPLNDVMETRAIHRVLNGHS